MPQDSLHSVQHVSRCWYLIPAVLTNVLFDGIEWMDSTKLIGTLESFLGLLTPILEVHAFVFVVFGNIP